MKQLTIMLVIVLCACSSFGQTNNKSAILYGKTEISALTTEPYSKWYDSTYQAYQPNEKIINKIKSEGVRDVRVEIYYGTWCGDSRREVPRMMKVLDVVGIKNTSISLIALGGNDSLYKQSPAGEETGKGIFRVPVMIVYKNGKEAGRINEYPAMSLEQDLLLILSGKPYMPNYKTFALVNEWLTTGALTDKNTSMRGLAMQLKSLTGSEHELNSLGYVFLKQHKKAEALRIFQLNALLYPESANVASSLGEGYLENGDVKMAIATLERSLLLNKDAELLKEILTVLYKAKGYAQ